MSQDERIKGQDSFNLETVLWKLGNLGDRVLLDPQDIINHKLEIRNKLIGAGLHIEEIEKDNQLVDLALTSKMRRMTDRGAVLVTALGEADVVDYVRALPATLTRQQRFDALWPRLRNTRIIALRAGLQSISGLLQLLESGEIHSQRRGPEQFAADLITISLVHPKITPEVITNIVDKTNARVSVDHDPRISSLTAPETVLADLTQVMSISTDQLPGAFYVDQFDPWVLLGNDVKPPKKIGLNDM